VIDFTVAFIIGVATGVVLGVLIGAVVQTRLDRGHHQALASRVDRLEKIVADRLEFIWPIRPNGDIPQGSDVA